MFWDGYLLLPPQPLERVSLIQLSPFWRPYLTHLYKYGCTKPRKKIPNAHFSCLLDVACAIALASGAAAESVDKSRNTVSTSVNLEALRSFITWENLYFCRLVHMCVLTFARKTEMKIFNARHAARDNVLRKRSVLCAGLAGSIADSVASVRKTNLNEVLLAVGWLYVLYAYARRWI